MGEFREDICLVVTETVADALETPVEELPPIAEVVDLDALDSLVTEPPGESSSVTVSFTYAGLRVLVHGNDFVYAYPMGDGGGDAMTRPTL